MSKKNFNIKKKYKTLFKRLDVIKSYLGARFQKDSEISLTYFIFRWIFILGIWGCISIVLLIAFYSLDLPSTSKLTEHNKMPNIKIVNEKSELVANYGEYYGSYLEYESFPPDLIQAVLATEDRRFFEHFGIDLWGLFRATLVNIRAGKVVQGGSTITQQLAKIAFLTPERALKRKIQEMILALWFEAKFTKKEILTMYLNRVYLGGGNFGVDSAARSYFGKSARNLTLSESAVIAGLLRAPSRYSPTSNPTLSAKRASQVLVNMADAGFISLETAVKAEKELHIENKKPYHGNLYFTDWVVEQLPEYIGNVSSDITVVTTINLELQKNAEEAVNKVLAESLDLNVSQAALLSVANDGRILAMVGGKNYKSSQFNRVTQAMRQPGSAFKLFVYLAAFEKGYSPDSEMEDKPVEFGNWAPENYKEEYHGVMNFSEAFARSINSIAVQLGYEIGVESVVEMAQRLGITSKLMAIPSAVLGTNEVTLLEMVQAYNVMSNDGYLIKVYGIKQVTDADGNVLYERQQESPEPVVDINVVRSMNSMLIDVVEHGTARYAKLDRPAGGKTGTTQEYRDAWFIGFTPQITTGVWAGNDNYTPTKEVTGGKVPANIWKEYMTAAHEGLPVLEIPTSSISMLSPFNYMRYMRSNDDFQRLPVDTGPSFLEKIFGGKKKDNENTQDQPNHDNSKIKYEYPTPRN